jgi:outer membrane protein TolC
MIARGIDAAVQLESDAEDDAGQDAAVTASAEFVLGVSRVWHLAELVAAALEANPATREAWQLARAAAAREQSALAAYGPDIGVKASADLSTEPGLSNSPSKSLIDTEFRFAPQVYLTWVLLDFGRRDAATDRTRAELAAANLTHDRTIQRVLYEVERGYFALEAMIGLRLAAAQDVESARSVLEATEERLILGLATRPDALIARQSYAEALYQLEKSRADVFVAEGDLRTSVGFSANLAIPIDATPEGELPPALAVGVDGIIDMALTQRPDLAAAVLDLRAREADIRRAEASFMPQIDFGGAVGPGYYNFNVEGLSLEGEGWELQGRAMLGGSWLLYDGGARDAALAQVHAQRSAAAARLAALRLDAENQVWRAYFELQSNRAQYDAAKALVMAASDSFDSVRESYQLGLSTLPEMLDSERDLFEARAQRIQSRADFLTSSAQLVFACGAGAGEVVRASDR